MLPGTNPLPKDTHRLTHGSSCTRSRGWPCWAPVEGEALDLAKTGFPSVGECCGGVRLEVGVNEEDNTFIDEGEEDGIGVLCLGNWERE